MHDHSAHAEELISVKSVSLDASTILELKNNRGNDFNIDQVRIWLPSDDSFKSFKTEKGWTGKFEVGGKVLAFKPQTPVKPGESVKFGLKTNSENPIINWKTLDGDRTIETAATITKQSDQVGIIPEINQPKIVAINDNSFFRFIPEKPSIGSDFRIIGENFIPNQHLELYIADQMVKLIKIDNNGKFISTASVPNDLSPDRTEFALVDSGGTEKMISIRVNDSEIRELSTDAKISIEFTPKSAKRGETITLEGVASPDSTLTVTSKYQHGDVLSIDTITTDFNGKWKFDKLFPTDLSLGTIMLEITDGKSTAVRNFDIISSQLINISPSQSRYEVGDTVRFSGTAIPNEQISLIVEDPSGMEVFSESFKVPKSGNIEFNFETMLGFVEGTYVLHSFQMSETGISVVGLGVIPQQVLTVSTSNLNYSMGDDVVLRIHGEPHASVSVVLIDESDQTKINDSVELDDNGNYSYFVGSNELGTGAFEVEIRHGVTRGYTVFTVGLSTGSGPIEFQLTKAEYYLGDQILIIGNTGNSVILSVAITDPTGTIIRELETFSDRIGTFKVDTFKIPSNGKFGQWTVAVSSDENIVEQKFNVIDNTGNISVMLDKADLAYKLGDMVTITGKNALLGSSVQIFITDSAGFQVTPTLLISITATGEYYTLWQIPSELEPGTYEILVDDGFTDNSISFTIN